MADLGSSIDIPVYLGVWTNWSHGRIAGVTLTLTNRNGAFLTAFLAVFIAFVGTSFWRIARFTLHQLLSSSEKPKNGFYHQIQAVLRNSETGSTLLVRLFYILWAWRHKTNQSVCQMITLLTTIALITAGFTVTSIFSAKISSGIPNEVLISSAHCGKIYPGDPNIVDNNMSRTIIYPYLSKKANFWANYVQTCYTNTQGDGCGSFIKRQLSSTIDRNANCPFQPDMCRSQNRNLKIDTGPLYIDSDLGLNIPPDLRYTLQFTTQCAPINMNGYTEVFNYSNESSFMRYFYGRPIISEPRPGENRNYTFEYPVTSIFQTQRTDFASGMADYRLSSESACSYNASFGPKISTFTPIDKLLSVTKDSDLSIFFLSANDISFSSEVNDDWYAAHRFVWNTTLSSYSGYSEEYLSDEPASVLGCKAHYETCISGSPSKCVVSGGLYDLQNPVIAADSEAYSIITYMINNYADLSNIVSALMTSSLTARHGLFNGYQGPLPDNQWQSEVEFWHNVGLVSLQGVTGSAIGPDDTNVLKYFWQAPDSFQREKLCQNQKIRSSSYTNFSVLGLAITLIVGGLIIILGYTLEQIIVLFETHVLGAIKHSRFEWSSNDILQTQRMAHEELGLGTWKGCSGVNAVPVTQKEELLAALDVRDPEHPRLLQPSSASRDNNDVVAKTKPYRASPAESPGEEGAGGVEASHGDHQYPSDGLELKACRR